MSDIFDKIDETRVAENNIRRLTGLEIEQARRLQKEYVRARNSIKLRLAHIPHGTFTEAQLKVTLTQIEQMLRELQDITGKELLIGAQISTEQAVEDMVKELRVLDKKFLGVVQPISLDRLLVAIQPENYLINRFASSLASYNSALRSGIERALTDTVIRRQSSFQAIERIDNFMGMQEWKVSRIVRTEFAQYL